MAVAGKRLEGLFWSFHWTCT